MYINKLLLLKYYQFIRESGLEALYAIWRVASVELKALSRLFIEIGLEILRGENQNWLIILAL
jgi:hypothetical protein